MGQVGVTVQPGIGGEQLAYQISVFQCLADRLRALGEEPARGIPVPAAVQPPRSNDPGGPRGENLPGGTDPGPVRGDQAASAAGLASATAARATSTRPANAVASLTARSARILRSTSTPASRRPWIRRL
jgi:hypothetical protein